MHDRWNHTADLHDFSNMVQLTRRFPVVHMKLTTSTTYIHIFFIICRHHHCAAKYCSWQLSSQCLNKLSTLCTPISYTTNGKMLYLQSALRYIKCCQIDSMCSNCTSLSILFCHLWLNILCTRSLIHVWSRLHKYGERSSLHACMILQDEMLMYSRYRYQICCARTVLVLSLRPGNSHSLMLYCWSQRMCEYICKSCRSCWLLIQVCWIVSKIQMFVWWLQSLQQAQQHDAFETMQGLYLQEISDTLQIISPQIGCSFQSCIHQIVCIKNICVCHVSKRILLTMGKGHINKCIVR